MRFDVAHVHHLTGLSIDLLSHQTSFLIVAAIPALCGLAVVLHRADDAGDGLFNGVTEIIVGDGANPGDTAITVSVSTGPAGAEVHGSQTVNAVNRSGFGATVRGSGRNTG